MVFEYNPDPPFKFLLKCKQKHFKDTMDRIDRLNTSCFDRRERKSKFYLAFRSVTAEGFYAHNKDKILAEYNLKIKGSKT